MKNFIFILILTLLFSNVFFVDVNNHLIGDGFDNYEFFGFMHLAKENILSGRHPFSHTNTLRYPDGFDFSFGFDGVFAVLTGGVLSIFTNSILSYNLTIVLILFLNLIFSYVYFRKFAKLRGSHANLDQKALMSAIIFGVSPYVFARMNGHLNLALVAGVPMLIYHYANLNKKIVQRESDVRPADYISILVAVLLISLGSLQYLILLAFITPFALLLTIKKEQLQKYKEFLKSNLKGIINSLSLFILLFTLLFYGYIGAIISGDLVIIDSRQKFYEPHVMDVFVPNKYLGELWGFFNPSEKAIERVITVGTIELGILLFLLLKLKDKWVRFFGISLFLIYLFLSFGIWEIPYYSEGGRTVVILSLFIALMIVSYDRFFAKPVLTGLLLTAIIVERLFFHVQVSVPLAAGVLKEEVSPLPGTAVLNVPLSKYSSYRSALPYFYDKKVLDGYFHYTAATEESESVFNEKHFSRLVCQFERVIDPETGFSPGDRPEAVAAFKEKDVGGIVLFKDDRVGKFLYDDCYNVRDWWFYLNPETLVLSQDSPGVVKNNFQLEDHNPHTLARFYFEKGGRFYLNGLLVTPETYDDINVKLPSGEIVVPEWKVQDGGITAQFDPPLEAEVEAGDSVMIMSDEPSTETRYINAYYVFEANRSEIFSKPIPIELVYSDSKVEVYKLN